MTHRVFSRNAASSRAIPVTKLIERVASDPFLPESFGKNQPGMQASEALTGRDEEAAYSAWEEAKCDAVRWASRLADLGVHKQLANRLLEPFQWYTVILSATEFSNFFALRCHPDAQPEIQRIAILMREAMEDSAPTPLGVGEWHLPLTPDFAQLAVEFDIEAIKRISAGRCARVSYLTHHGERDPQADIDLCDRLVSSGHMSPLEHVATPAPNAGRYGNFTGWVQMRKSIPGESDFGLPRVD